MPELTRITRDSAMMGGKPCIRRMRVTVGSVVGLVAAGRTRDEILREYPYLEAEDIVEALSYAAWRAEGKSKFRCAGREAARGHKPVAKLVDRLARHGFETVHWSTIGAATAPDVEILRAANEHHFVVITNDLDFSAILAAGAVDGPGVV